MKYGAFGRYIRKMRIKRKWSSDEFRGVLQYAFSPAYLTKIELHGEIPSPEMVIKMARALQVHPNKLWQKAMSEKIARYKDGLINAFINAWDVE